jgi:hypothetical protein
MVSFSKLPGMVALCIVVLTSTLGSAAPVPQNNGHESGLPALVAPAVEGVAIPLLKGVGDAVAEDGVHEVTDGLGDTLDEDLHAVGKIGATVEEGAGVAVANAGSAVWGTVYVQSW